MTWEILCGLITILSSMIAVGTVLVKLIRTLATLESAVRELKDFITRQTGKNDYFFKFTDFISNSGNNNFFF